MEVMKHQYGFLRGRCQQHRPFDRAAPAPYIKFIKPKQGAKVSADPDDYEFEDEEYENEDVPEQGEQEDQN